MTRVDVDDLRARHPLAEVAQRSGFDVCGGTGKVMVCCPMPDHADSTPSMQLDLRADRFRCFGCGAHGDALQFVESMYCVGFREAVDLLEAGGSLPIPPGGSPASKALRVVAQIGGPEPERSSKDEVVAALDDAWTYYSSGELHDEATAYLADRGIDVSALEAEVGGPVAGYSPKGRFELCRYLRGAGHSTNVLIDAGLARQVDPGRPPLDAYRGRLVLAVRDENGQVVGFLGRDTTGREDTPKYLNPPHTVAYDKSVNLYQPPGPSPRAGGQVVVVEGSLDALAIAALAAKNALAELYRPVSASGLAISSGQWETLLGLALATPIVLAADGDDAGAAANKRWQTDLAKLGRRAYVTTWPDGTDPASYLAEHGVSGLAAITVPPARHHVERGPARRCFTAPTRADPSADLPCDAEPPSTSTHLSIGA